MAEIAVFLIVQFLLTGVAVFPEEHRGTAALIMSMPWSILVVGGAVFAECLGFGRND